jgi:hypothetical protein
MYFKDGMGYFPMKGIMSTNFSQIWCTTKWKKANVFQPFLSWSGIVGTTIIKNVFIAKGSKPPSSWTAAPEDTNVRLSAAEATIVNQGNAITQKVSLTDYNGNTIASMINQTATTIKIQASKINLVGAVTVLSDITGKLGSITAGNIDGVKITGSRFTTSQRGGTADETYELDLYNSNVTSKATYAGTIFGTVVDQLEIIQGQLWVSQYINNVKQSHITFDANAISYFHGTTFVATGKVQFGNNFIDVSSFAELIANRITMDARAAQRSLRFNAGTGGEAGLYGSNSGTGQGRVGAYDWALSRHIWYYERGDNTFNVVPKGNFSNGARITGATGETEFYTGSRESSRLWDDNTNIGWTYGTSAFFKWQKSNARFEAKNYGDTAWVNVGALGWYTASSRKWKKNIRTFDEQALKIVNSARITNYQLSDEYEDRTIKIGLIAEEAPKEFLSPQSDTVDMYATLSVALKAIQELSTKVDMLESAMQGVTVTRPRK